jgi:hypothetical protein
MDQVGRLKNKAHVCCEGNEFACSIAASPVSVGTQGNTVQYIATKQDMTQHTTSWGTTVQQDIVLW